MKNNKKSQLSAILFVFAILCYQSIFSQSHKNVFSTEYEGRLIPNNPNIATLGTYGNNPIDKYTGTANISIPLHSINLDGLTIPLNLNYNTGGIKASQEASWVGLGWNLGSGGFITSEINGFDDTKGQNTDDQPLGYIYVKSYVSKNPPTFELEITEEDEAELVVGNQIGRPIDTEPDIFTATLFGKTVKFVLEKLETGSSVSSAKVVGTTFREVLFDTGDLSFKITDEDGFVYHFNHVEYSTPYTSARGTYNNIETEDNHIREIHQEIWSIHDIEQDRISWQVSKVVSPFGHELTFDYIRTLNISYPSISEEVDLHCNQLFGNRVGPNPFSFENSISPNHTARFYVFENVTLSKISGDFGTIDFVLDNREDLFGETSFNSFLSQERNTTLPYKMPVASKEAPKKLNAVVVKNMNGKIVKNVSFLQSYFNSPKLGDLDQQNFVRLKLDEVLINDRKYVFDYISPNNLPEKRSKSTDFWGFYNGADNPHRIPKFARFTASWSPDALGYEFYHIYDNGTTRKSDFNFGNHGLLNKVVYPTGGYTNYVYEPNTASVLRPTSYDAFLDSEGNFKSSRRTSSDDYSWNYQYLKMANDSEYSLVNSLQSCTVNTDSFVRQEEFTITQTEVCDLSYNVKINTTFSCSTGCGEGIPPSGEAVWIRNLDTDQVIPVFNFTQPQNNPNGLWTLELEKELNLAPGNYRFETEPAWSNSSPLVVVTNMSSLQLVSQEISNPPTNGNAYEEFEVGGARVKKILEHDQDGTLLSSRSYNYDEEKESGLVQSSGLLMNQLQYHSKNNGFFEYTPEHYYDNTVNVHSNNILRMRNSASGKHLGYSKVTETIVSTANESESNGKIETTFFNKENEYVTRFVGNASAWRNEANPPTFFYGNVNLNGVLPKCYDFYNGKVISEEVFTNSNELRTSTVNEYEISETPSFINAGLPYPHISYQLYVLPTECPTTTCGFFPLLPFYQPILTSNINDHKYARLKKTTQTSFETTGEISTTRDYFYGSGPHYLPSVVTTTDSDGELITSKSFYPIDFPSDPMIVGLANNNRHTVPVKTELFRGTDTNPEEKMISQTQTQYDALSPSGLIMPSEILTLKGVEGSNNSLDKRVRYNKYDDKGNLLEYQLESGTEVSYIWGYNREYVVAQMINASYEDVEGVFSAAILNSIGDNGLSIAEAETLRSGLPNAMVTTYTYDPLVGITSVTDPRDYTMHYEYDEFNRLKYVRDANNKLISENEYNYKNQNQNQNQN